jgi:hypothetical protein
MLAFSWALSTFIKPCMKASLRLPVEGLHLVEHNRVLAGQIGHFAIFAEAAFAVAVGAEKAALRPASRAACCSAGAALTRRASCSRSVGAAHAATDSTPTPARQRPQQG